MGAVGKATLFTALNVLDSTVLSICPQHRREEWLKFLRLIERTTPKPLAVHLIVDNYATHKHPAVQLWLTKHPRFIMHSTPTSASWLNMVERFFRDISENRIKRDSFASVADLERAIAQYIAHHNSNPKPFVWTASTNDILAKVTRATAALPQRTRQVHNKSAHTSDLGERRRRSAGIAAAGQPERQTEGQGNSWGPSGFCVGPKQVSLGY